MKRYLLASLLAAAVIGVALQAGAATYYVDNVNGADVNDGLSWGNALASLTNAAAVLAATNSATGFSGGHLVLVTNGPYVEEVVLTESHRGADGNPNVFRGVGDPVIRHGYYSPWYRGAFHIDGSGTGEGQRADYVSIETMMFNSSALHYGVRLRDGHGVVIKNCTSYEGAGGFHIGPESDGLVIENCTVFSCHDDGIYENANTGSLTIRNCIFSGCGQYGVYTDDSSPAIVSNCCFFANALGNLRYTDGAVYVTESSINGAGPDAGNNVVGCPGFAALAQDWNFDSFFANSPCLNAADDGGNLGAYQEPAVISVSPDTWYVKTNGNDSASGTDWAHAWQTLSTAASTAGPGDTVVVQAGTYNEAVDITRGGCDDLWVTYQAEGDVYVESSGNTFEITNVSLIVLDGFRITSTGGKGAVRFEDAPSNVVRNCDIDGSTYGVAIYDTAHTVVRNCDVHDASSDGVHHNFVDGYAYGHERTYVMGCRLFDNGGNGFWQRSGGCVIKDCEIYGNSGSGLYAASGSHARRSDVVNCNVYSNAHGIWADTHGGFEAYNCTAYGNTGDGLRTGGGYANTGLFAYNCITAGNGGYGADEMYAIYSDTRGIFAKHCLFWENGTGGTQHFKDSDLSTTNEYSTAAQIDLASPSGSCTNTILANPLFVYASTNNFRLQASSPCIDAGDETYTPGLAGSFAEDGYGAPRVRMDEIDIGASEWQPRTGMLILGR